MAPSKLNSASSSPWPPVAVLQQPGSISQLSSAAVIGKSPTNIDAVSVMAIQATWTSRHCHRHPCRLCTMSQSRFEIVLRLRRDRGAVMYVEGFRSAAVAWQPDVKLAHALTSTHAWTEALDKESDPGFEVPMQREWHLQAFLRLGHARFAPLPHCTLDLAPTAGSRGGGWREIDAGGTRH